MENEVENEINHILRGAIAADLENAARKNDVEKQKQASEEQVSNVPRCSICCSQKPRYKCPACLMKTCSLECVKQHKIDENCSGKRDPTKKIEKKEMGERMLLSDYRFLEDANRHLYGIQRKYEISFKPYPKNNRNYLYQQSMAKGFVLWNLPDGMVKRQENTTVVGSLPGMPGKYKKPLKMFQFHIKWIFDLSSGKQVVVDTKIVETWNVGKIAEKAIEKLEDPSELVQSKTKSDCEDKSEQTLDSDDTGIVSGSSLEPVQVISQDNGIEMTKAIEKEKQKYAFNVFMQRVYGTKKFYQFSNENSLRENLDGKAIIEYPELLIVPHVRCDTYQNDLTTTLDFRRGVKPVRPSFIPATSATQEQKEWKSAVNMSKVDMEPWQKEALNATKHSGDRTGKRKRKNRGRKKPGPTSKKPSEEVTHLMSCTASATVVPTTPLPSQHDTQPMPKLNMSQAMKFFDTSQISSDSESN